MDTLIPFDDDNIEPQSAARQGPMIAGTYWTIPQGDRRILFIRAAEFERLVEHRYAGGVLPDVAEARKFARAFASNSVVHPDHARQALKAMAPWCGALSDGVRLAIADDPEWFDAEQFGTLVALTKDERKALRITTFRVAHMSDDDMDAATRLADRDRKRAGRAEARAANPKPPSWDALAPWKELGIGRRKFFDLKAEVEKQHPELGSGPCTEIVRSKLIELVRTSLVHGTAATACKPTAAAIARRAQCAAQGYSERTFYRRQADAKRKAEAGAPAEAQSPTTMKAKHKRRPAPWRGRAAGAEGVARRFLLPPGTRAARAAPPFGDVSDFAIPGSLRIPPLASIAANHLVSAEAYRNSFALEIQHGA